ncbi:phage tail sheath subtilisin-like domain-containing protein [Intestinimonas massiliensis (ex Afouda et al. 2020)]|uniref:phage tail sheath subtilisin-like domain-containing protein n=1 Tax=Intestinimonas massiliensis (ex Afouda et al. 2020) TaxID=1673721 RepID=UPI00067E70FC|nr:phage tail sheath subtilisin-like domain-containing protein [Intestinimonas massiliensis (ex Afouda et al. 2020)]
MGLPNINIAFQSTAASAVQRSEKGVVALILKDAKENGGHAYTNVTQVPSTLGAANQAYVQQAFLGYVNPPRKVLVYVLPAEAEALTDALSWLATQVFDYLAGPPNCSEPEATAISTWIASRRTNDAAICKAVLPNQAADSEAIVNFTTDDILVGSSKYTTAQYCARIAGLIAGTPMTISCTYAPLAEVSDIGRLTRAEMDAAINAGKFILFHDGEKVKVGRGVNSLQTTTQDKGDAWKKIKLVEVMDMIQTDIRTTAQDSYIGKYANSYDNKCLLISAIKGYLTSLEQAGILRAGSSSVGIDTAAQEAYLQSTGVDTSKLSEQEIKEANTGDKVFLQASIQILDAIEDINLNITI